jgi:dCMP deaminase
MLDEKWDRRFLELAKHISSWSKDPSTQTGAVIVGARRDIVSVGYNGMPIGVKDTYERLYDRETKLKCIVHCERNALLFANKSMIGCTLYTWPFMSCAACAGMVIQAGISRCVAPTNDNPRWKDEFALATEMFSESGVALELVKGYF